jgi:dolichol-phosphate mannosyltransferase
MTNILLLGSSGFVGKNLFDTLSVMFNVHTTQRKTFINSDIIYFDIEKVDTWKNLLSIDFDIVINSIGYGVVKTENDANKLFQINYVLPMRLREYLLEKKTNTFWLQIGTAFEYSLSEERITEESQTNPSTLYGISKLMFSNYLNQSSDGNYLLLRPFAMFGKYEEKSKIVPALINAQKECETLSLSTGDQQRDYFFVGDFTNFIAKLISDNISNLSQRCINVGSGIPQKLTAIADIIAVQCPNYSIKLWNWGKLEQRVGESSKFYNASTKCYELGFLMTPIEISVQKTVQFYFENN